MFSDGVDDDLEALEQKSEELKKKGIYFRKVRIFNFSGGLAMG